MTDTPGAANLIVVAALLGLIPGWIASRKGYSFGKWWLFGALLWILALPLILMAPKNAQTRRQCPHCREWVDREATVCRQCHRDLPVEEVVVSRRQRLIDSGGPMPVTAPQPAGQPADSLPTWLLATIVAATVAAVVFGVWVLSGV